VINHPQEQPQTLFSFKPSPVCFLKYHNEKDKDKAAGAPTSLSYPEYITRRFLCQELKSDSNSPLMFHKSDAEFLEDTTKFCRNTEPETDFEETDAFSFRFFFPWFATVKLRTVAYIAG
jgi:hypothetical protein